MIGAYKLDKAALRRAADMTSTEPEESNVVQELCYDRKDGAVWINHLATRDQLHTGFHVCFVYRKKTPYELQKLIEAHWRRLQTA